MSKSDYFAHLIKLRQANHLKVLETYKARLPFKSKELPPEYVVTENNPNPPVVHCSIPIKDLSVLYRFAERRDVTCFDPLEPSKVSVDTLVKAVEVLQEDIEYKLDVVFPFGPTADCEIVIALYDNRDIKERQLIVEQEQEIVQCIKSELGLEESVELVWYFNADDPYQPDD